MLNKAISRIEPGFSLSSEASEEYAKCVLIRLCHQLVAGEIRPYRIRRIIEPIERIYDFPAWQEGFFDAFDEIEPDTKINEIKPVIMWVEKYLQRVKDTQVSGV